MDWSGLYLQAYISPLLGKICRFIVFRLLENEFVDAILRFKTKTKYVLEVRYITKNCSFQCQQPLENIPYFSF